MDHSILRVLAAEVNGRNCPGCARPLKDAEISARFSASERVQLSFRCRHCEFEGGGEIALTPELYEEAAASAPARLPAPPALPAQARAPITADEVLAAHELLERWHGRFPDLFQPQADLLPPG